MHKLFTKRMRLILLFVISITFFACKKEIHKENPIVKVFESTLYPSEIKEFIPEGVSPDDSIVLAQNYIRNWITQKLLLYKAIENLSQEESNIQKQVEEYRTTLLIHQYKQKLINERLQDDIKESDIETYYKANEKNFILATSIVKAVFCIVPKNAPNIKEVRKWYASDNESDQENLEDYCLTHARKYDKFENQWVEATFLQNLMPAEIKLTVADMNSPKNIERADTNNYYFLKIKDVKKEQTIAPLEYVRDEIIMILKNKKKILFENELEKQINEEGIRKNYVKIF